MPKDFNIYEFEFTKSGAGGRISSPELRRSQELSESFSGLEENIKRYDLLLLVKRVGKGAGFSPRMIELLDYYMSFTRDVDWEQGSRPIVYQSLSKTSLDLGVSERQIQHLEKQLFELGAITWNDSGNHKRYPDTAP
jgi:replication initiation protein RepC